MARTLPHRKQSWIGYLFLTPNFLGFLMFMFIPLVVSMILSFTDWQMLTWPPRFVGFGNFQKLLGFRHGAGGWVLSDPDFWKFLYNTIYLMIGLPISMAASLFLAVLVSHKLRGIVAFRVLFFLPTICSGIGILMLWRLMYDMDSGMINRMLSWIGIHGPDWLNSTTWAKPALVISGIWAGAGGYNMIIYLAALTNIPPQLYEAADIDGAGRWKKFRHVTWPMLAPTTFFIFTMGMIGGFQGGFNAAYIMTRGGPVGSTTSISYYIYNMAYTGNLEMGYGCAIAWVLFVMVFCVTLINWRYGGKSATEGWVS
jgi:multiple sugar transport system permease protein